MPDNPFEEFTLDDIMHVYMIIETRFDLKSASYIPKFIEEAGIFGTLEKALTYIEDELEQQPRIWYSIAPLWIPKELDSREFMDCLTFDTMIKEKLLCGEEEEEETLEEEDGANIIDIEDVWAPHGGIPGKEEEDDDDEEDD